MNAIKFLVLLCFVLSSASCSPKTIQIDSVLNSNQCGISQEKIVYITNKNQYQELLKASFNNFHLIKFADFDFNKASLIVVAMGQQPSTGYNIELVSTKATIENGSLTLNAVMNKPSSGGFNATMITTPCALYKIDKLSINKVILIQ